MQQLNGKTGEVEAEVVGGERIFSIPDTEKIVQLAVSAKDDEALIALGTHVVASIKKQDSRKPQFTKP